MGFEKCFRALKLLSTTKHSKNFGYRKRRKTKHAVTSYVQNHFAFLCWCHGDKTLLRVHYEYKRVGRLRFVITHTTRHTNERLYKLMSYLWTRL